MTEQDGVDVKRSEAGSTSERLVLLVNFSARIAFQELHTTKHHADTGR